MEQNLNHHTYFIVDTAQCQVLSKSVVQEVKYADGHDFPRNGSRFAVRAESSGRPPYRSGAEASVTTVRVGPRAPLPFTYQAPLRPRRVLIEMQAVEGWGQQQYLAQCHHLPNPSFSEIKIMGLHDGCRAEAHLKLAACIRSEVYCLSSCWFSDLEFGIAKDHKHTYRFYLKYCLYANNYKHGEWAKFFNYVRQI